MLPAHSRSKHFMVVFLMMILVSLVCIDPYNGTLICQASPPAQNFTGHENHSISLSDAAALTKNFRATAPPGSVTGEFFGKDAIQSILNQPGAVGMRIYYGKKNDGTPVLILVGADSTGNDLVGGQLAQFGFPCPPICPASSELNK